MTKQQEILRLDGLIKSLGEDSYLGPWLQSVRAEVEQAIRSDIIPEISLAHTAEICKREMREVAENRRRIIENAEKEAAAIVNKANEKANRFTSNALSSLRNAIKEIEQ